MSEMVEPPEDAFMRQVTESLKRAVSWPPGYRGIEPGDFDARARVKKAAWDAFDAAKLRE